MELFWEARDADSYELNTELSKISDSQFELSIGYGDKFNHQKIRLDRKDLKDLHDAIEHLMGWRKES